MLTVMPSPVSATSPPASATSTLPAIAVEVYCVESVIVAWATDSRFADASSSTTAARPPEACGEETTTA
ncbi:hypothetical protein [Escherichia coli]|uniref:hypothetical protein n=1 Tax=Escherichia coli TaxID=562 RepID=UPI00351CA655